MNGLKTFWHILLECCTMEARPIQSYLNTATNRSVCALGGDKEGLKRLFREQSKQAWLQKPVFGPWSDSPFPPLKGMEKSEQSHQKKRLRAGEQNAREEQVQRRHLQVSCLERSSNATEVLFWKRNHQKYRIKCSSSHNNVNILPLKYRLAH